MRANRSEFSAHAALSASRGVNVARAPRAIRNAYTLADLAARMPRLFAIAATVAAVIVVAAGSL